MMRSRGRGLNSRRERRTAWNALATTFSGKLPDMAGWEIYIAELERLARPLDIPEEEKVRKLFEAVPKGWQESILWAEGKVCPAFPRVPAALKSG